MCCRVKDNYVLHGRIMCWRVNYKDKCMLVLDKNKQSGILGNALKDGMMHFRSVPEIREVMTHVAIRRRVDNMQAL